MSASVSALNFRIYACAISLNGERKAVGLTIRGKKAEIDVDRLRSDIKSEFSWLMGS